MPSHPGQNQRLEPYSVTVDPEELSTLSKKLCERFKWDAPHDFQLAGINAQLEGKDAIIHVATSMGKTAVAAGPFVLPSIEKRVTIYIIPLLALQEEMATSFPLDYGVSAVVLNYTNASTEVMKEIVAGKYQVILISPESLLSPRFIKNVLSKPEFAHKVLSIVIDEAHCVSLYGAGFRKLYGRLPVVRTFLPQGLPFVALSATLTSRVHLDLVKRLELQSDYRFIDAGNDRPNVTLIVRQCVHPLNSFRDTWFAIPSGIQQASEIEKTFFYVDNVAEGTSIVDYLTGLLPGHLRDKGVVRPYNATFSAQYRTEAMRLFRQGEIRILVCTDAAGMGCNIPDVDRTIQWRSPEDIAPLHQRGGRVARDKSRIGYLVVLAEPKAYKIDPTEPAAATKTSKKGKRPQRVKGEGSGNRSRARKRQDINKQPQTKKKQGKPVGAGPTGQVHPDIQDDLPGGGIYAFIQAKTCRRAMIARIFNNRPPTTLTAPCCDICDPSVLAKVAPPPLEKRRRIIKSKQGEINTTLKQVLESWREEICERDYSHLAWAPDALLDDPTIDSIARQSDVGVKGKLAAVLDGHWLLWGQYGDELLARIQTSIPPALPMPQTAGACEPHTTPRQVSATAGGPVTETMNSS
ncbi:hypothetical protein FRC08_002855, partial [Ceratobasidium sp. 394]